MRSKTENDKIQAAARRKIKELRHEQLKQFCIDRLAVMASGPLRLMTEYNLHNKKHTTIYLTYRALNDLEKEGKIERTPRMANSYVVRGK